MVWEEGSYLTNIFIPMFGLSLKSMPYPIRPRFTYETIKKKTRSKQRAFYAFYFFRDYTQFKDTWNHGMCIKIFILLGTNCEQAQR